MLNVKGMADPLSIVAILGIVFVGRKISINQASAEPAPPTPPPPQPSTE